MHFLYVHNCIDVVTTMYWSTFFFRTVYYISLQCLVSREDVQNEKLVLHLIMDNVYHSSCKTETADERQG